MRFRNLEACPGVRQPQASESPARESAKLENAELQDADLVNADLSGVALLLAAVGIYGVMSYSVAQRGHEMGVRVALGAGRANILWLVLGQSLRLTAMGLLTGLAGSLLLTRLLASLLFDVKATDPLTYLVVALFLAVVAQAASLLPAWRATNIDPVNALRQE